MPQRTNRDKRLLRITLVGFMCSGKSTVGKILARKLGWGFRDTDEEVERREGLTIPQIFALKGELYFRELERRVLKDLLKEERVVIATGGGLGADPGAMALMRERSFVVWLRVSFEEFMKRCASDEGRPLLRRGDEELRDLLRRRERVYRSAHLTLTPTDPERTADKIIEAWESFRRG